MKKKIIGILVCTLLVIVTISPVTSINNKESGTEYQTYVESEPQYRATPQKDVDWWPMFHHDLNNTGNSSSPTAPETSHLLWTYKTGYRVHCSPAIVNRKVYIGSDDEKFYCLNADNGSRIWRNSIPGGTSTSSPCVVNSKVYVGTTYDYFYCWDADTGEEIWTFYKGYGDSRSPAVSDGKVYIPYHSGNLYPMVYCLNANNGTKIWNETFPDGEINHVAVYDGKVYVSHYYKKIYCLNGETGETIWVNNTGGRHGAPAIYDGKVYASANGIKCFDAETGEEYWHYQGSWSYCSPAVAYNKIYYVDSNGRFICLDADAGDEVWVYVIGNGYEHAYPSPAVADGKVYVSIYSDGMLLCLNASTGEFIWDYKVGLPGWQFSSPAITNGTVYIGGSTDYVYAFGGYEVPPDDPNKPSGPTQGVTNIEYTFCTSGDDPQGDKVQFRFDWDAKGSHDYGEWSNLVLPGITVCMKHAWNSNGTYEVKAQARDEHYALSNWSDALTVVIAENSPPNSPGDPDPENGSTNIDINADLSWNCSDPDGENLTYNVYFEKDDSTPDELISENQSETTCQPGTMEYSMDYYWRIVAFDVWGASTHGSAWNFSTTSDTNDPPHIPTNPIPKNDSTDIDRDADLSWTGGDPNPEDTVVYDVYLEANDPTPDNQVADDIPETIFDPGILEYETIYYWRIIAKDNHGASTWGPTWHFTTEKAEPDLFCKDSLSWTDVKPGSTVYGNFTVENNGELFSLLDWEVIDWPKEWGSWKFIPSIGVDIKPDDEPITVNISVIAPREKKSEFTGEIKIVNSENSSDYCTIDVYLATPKNKPFNFNFPLLNWLFERFPKAFPVLRQLLSL